MGCRLRVCVCQRCAHPGVYQSGSSDTRDTDSVLSVSAVLFYECCLWRMEGACAAPVTLGRPGGAERAFHKIIGAGAPPAVLFADAPEWRLT